MKKCLYCAQEIQDDVAFCHYCGHSQLTKPQPAPPETKNQHHRGPGCWGMLLVLVLIMGGIMALFPGVRKFATFFFSWDNLTNWGPTPTLWEPTATYRVVATPNLTLVCILHSKCAPISTVRPTRTIDYRPVTWKELVKFIEDDHTNWNAYDLVHYNCMDFAIDLIESAGKQNIKAWMVIVEFYNDEPDHAFVAFETTDRGIVFIEPQADIPYANPKVGHPLCDAWGKYECSEAISSIEYVQCDHSHYCSPYTP